MKNINSTHSTSENRRINTSQLILGGPYCIDTKTIDISKRERERKKLCINIFENINQKKIIDFFNNYRQKIINKELFILPIKIIILPIKYYQVKSNNMLKDTLWPRGLSANIKLGQYLKICQYNSHINANSERLNILFQYL